jgi:hypothetical protein
MTRSALTHGGMLLRSDVAFDFEPSSEELEQQATFDAAWEAAKIALVTWLNAPSHPGLDPSSSTAAARCSSSSPGRL